MPEITTKEILKRYGEIARTPDKQFGPLRPEMADAPGRSPDGSGASGRPAVPVASRIEPENMSQANAWQKESSVRPVQQHPNGSNGPYSMGNHSSSAQHLQEFQTHGSSYHLRSGSANSLQSHGGTSTPNRQSQRPGNWGRSTPSGPMGPPGAI